MVFQQIQKGTLKGGKPDRGLPIRPVLKAGGRPGNPVLLLLQRMVGNRTARKIIQARKTRIQMQAGTSAGSGLGAAFLNRWLKRKTTRNFTRFFRDLNAVISGFAGINRKLGLGDFSFLKPAAFLRESTVKGTSEYRDAENSAKAFCSAGIADLPKYCPKAAGPSCIRMLKKIRRTRCSNKVPAASVIYMFLALRGVTPAGKGRSAILFDQKTGELLETVIHEGIHRLRGRAWALYSRIGSVRVHPGTGAMLPSMKTSLDEGTVQIMTNKVISLMQKRGWFRGFVSSSYAAEVKYVMNMLNSHGKNVSFLKDAYFGASSDIKVADLRSWQ